MRQRLFLALLALCLVIPELSYAQVASSLALRATPAYPEAKEAYEVSLVGLYEESQRASIAWFIDGVASSEAQNETTLRIQEGTNASRIMVRVTYTDGSVLERTFTPSPYRIDIVVSADTTTPSFYGGRALPSSGSTITAHALVFLDGVEQKNLSYLWRVNGKVQDGGALTGKQSVTFTPQFEKESTISVDIIRGGVTLGQETVSVPIVEPTVQFYEHNPLRGLSTLALANPYLLIAEEFRLHAEPYFMKNNLSPMDKQITWEVNGIGVSGSAESPNELLIYKGDAGKAIDVSFRIQNMRELLQGVQKSLSIRF